MDHSTRALRGQQTESLTKELTQDWITTDLITHSSMWPENYTETADTHAHTKMLLPAAVQTHTHTQSIGAGTEASLAKTHREMQ